MYQGRHGRQGSQGLVFGWILRNRKWRRQRRRASEVAATMTSLPTKNLPWRPCVQLAHLEVRSTFGVSQLFGSGFCRVGVEFFKNSGIQVGKAYGFSYCLSFLTISDSKGRIGILMRATKSREGIYFLLSLCIWFVNWTHFNVLMIMHVQELTKLRSSKIRLNAFMYVSMISIKRLSLAEFRDE